MVVMSRFWGAAAVVFLVAGSGCGSETKSSQLTCTRSVAEFCAALPASVRCPLTWDDVENGQGACFGAGDGLVPNGYVDPNCGAYRVFKSVATDVGASFYYDATSGQLVAIVSFAAVGSVQADCSGGPPEGFTIPTCAPVEGGQARLDACADAPGI